MSAFTINIQVIVRNKEEISQAELIQIIQSNIRLLNRLSK